MLKNAQNAQTPNLQETHTLRFGVPLTFVLLLRLLGVKLLRKLSRRGVRLPRRATGDSCPVKRRRQQQEQQQLNKNMPMSNGR